MWGPGSRSSRWRSEWAQKIAKRPTLLQTNYSFVIGLNDYRHRRRQFIACENFGDRSPWLAQDRAFWVGPICGFHESSFFGTFSLIAARLHYHNPGNCFVIRTVILSAQTEKLVRKLSLLDSPSASPHSLDHWTFSTRGNPSPSTTALNLYPIHLLAIFLVKSGRNMQIT